MGTVPLMSLLTVGWNDLGEAARRLAAWSRDLDTCILPYLYRNRNDLGLLTKLEDVAIECGGNRGVGDLAFTSR